MTEAGLGAGSDGAGGFALEALGAGARGVPPRPMSLHDFCWSVREALQMDVSVVGELLSSCRPSVDALRPWIDFDPRGYSRRCLYRDEAFELLLLCWNQGQATPVHDHDGEAGWMTVLEGTLVVEEYERYGGPIDLCELRSEAPTPPGSVVVLPRRRLTLSAGSVVAEAAAPETIHRVRAADGRAVSLHLYVGPLDSFLVFDTERGTARRVRP